MEEIKRCFKCRIGFQRIGIISPEDEQTPHVIECRECENQFVSDVHLKYHIELYHDARLLTAVLFVIEPTQNNMQLTEN